MALLSVLCVCCLAACGARVDYYLDSSDPDGGLQAEIVLDAALVDALESSAAQQADQSAQWTLSGYLDGFAPLFGLESATSGDDETVVYSLFGPLPSGGDESDGDDNDYSYRVENGFYTRRVVVTEGSPFNGLRAAYEGETERTKRSVIDVLASGFSDASGKVVLPAIADAFPAIKSMNPDDLELRFLWHGADVTAENGSMTRVYGKSWQVWEGKFDRESRTISYSYTLPNPVGWYVTVVVLGLAAAGITLFATRKSKRAPALIDPKAKKRRSPVGVTVVYRMPPPAVSEADARRELEDIFSGRNEPESERERLRRRIIETLPPSEAAEAIKKLDEKEGK